jgi:SIR2-like domain
VLAALPVKIFVTTGWTDLLQDALKARGKRPETRSFRWTDRVDWNEPRSKIAEPTIDAPLVYHMFGRLDKQYSLVLTEDDYFEWLTAWIGDQKGTIPPMVKSALSNSSLLFLGFTLDDWDFRVVFQSIKSFAGGSQNVNCTHIGVQLKPENQLIEPDSAQKYIESYFNENRVNIYWADTRAFLDELCRYTRITP